MSDEMDLPPYWVCEQPELSSSLDNLRQLEASDVANFIYESLTKYMAIEMSACMLFYGARGSGKSSLLFQTQFIPMLIE